MKKNLYRVLSALLLLSLLISTVPALAATPLSHSLPTDVKEVRIERGKSAVVLITTVNSTKSGSLELTVKDYTNGKATIQHVTKKVKAGDKIKWKLDFDTELPNAKALTKHLVYTFKMDGKTSDYSLYLTYDKKTDTILVEKGTWYPDNTACCFGLPLRDMPRPKTDKWFHVTPIDLSLQGDQEFAYIGSNLYILGKVIVTVSGDTVFVNYHNFYESQGGNTKTTDEFMTIFHDLSEVTVNTARVPRSFAFGQPISIENDLDGDTNVLLFILNHVTYCDYVTGTHKLTRYWHNLQENKALRYQMELLMEQDN